MEILRTAPNFLFGAVTGRTPVQSYRDIFMRAQNGKLVAGYDCDMRAEERRGFFVLGLVNLRTFGA